LTNSWAEITRLGESGFLLPIGLILWFWLMVARCYRAALIWAIAFGSAILVVVASKVAFIGWGIGIRSIDFTGFSGHTMLAAALFPALAYAMTGGARQSLRIAAIASALLFAALIAISRVVLEAHSISEVVGGFALGALAALCLIRYSRLGAQAALPAWVVLLAVLASGAISVGHRAPSHHIIVTLALKLSGHEHPYRRIPWHQHADDAMAGLTRAKAVWVAALPAPGISAGALDVEFRAPA